MTLAVALALAAGAVLAVPAPGVAPTCLVPPVDAVIAARFVEPTCPYCAGRRGIGYHGVSGSAVRAAASGEVTFSGLVAGTRYVVVRHGDGLLATYGGLAASGVSRGEYVVAGDTIGRSGAALHFGLRIPATEPGPDRYIDPEPLLGAIVTRPYLVPTDGTPGRPAPLTELRC